MAHWSDANLRELRRLLARAADAIAHQRQVRARHPLDLLTARATIRALQDEVTMLDLTLRLVAQLLTLAQATLPPACSDESAPIGSRK